MMFSPQIKATNNKSFIVKYSILCSKSINICSILFKTTKNSFHDSLFMLHWRINTISASSSQDSNWHLVLIKRIERIWLNLSWHRVSFGLDNILADPGVSEMLCNALQILSSFLSWLLWFRPFEIFCTFKATKPFFLDTVQGTLILCKEFKF